MTAPLVAHAGGFGWDEALFVLLPVVVLLVLARQARKNVDETETGTEPLSESPERPSPEG